MSAAGGVVWRRSENGGPEVLVVHRPHRADWSFPKGKREPGEADEACALREVEEETGISCALGRELISTSYRDHQGRPKTVRYWTMSPEMGSFRVNDEVDRAEWLTPEAARGRLTYAGDRQVLAAFEEQGRDR